MEGYLIDFETPDGAKQPHWDYSDNILYKVEENNGVSSDVTVTLALDRLNTSITSHTRTLNTINGTLITVQQDISALESSYRGLNTRVTALETATPVAIDDETGNWIINGQITEYPSRGESGSSFTYDDLTPEQITELAQNIANSLGGGTSGGGGVAGKGTFNTAWHYATDDIPVIDPETEEQELDENEQPVYTNRKAELFSWILEDVDDNNESVVNVIYHTGNGNFIDALGSEIVGETDNMEVSI